MHFNKAHGPKGNKLNSKIINKDMVEANAPSAVKLLFVVDQSFDIQSLINKMKNPITDQYDIIGSQEAYDNLADKYTYDGIVAF